MKTKLWNRAAAIAVFMGALMSLGASWSAGAGVFPPGSKPHGMTYSDWSAEWADWALSTTAEQSPFLDPDGRYCRLAQSQPVFFLGSNFGGETVRDCIVPAGQSILFSAGGDFCILNLSADTEQGLRDCIEFVLGEMSNVRAEINGVPVQNLEKHRVISKLFTFTLPDNNLFGLPAGDYQAIVGGYFLMHPPLPAGEHTIRFHDEFPAFDFVSDVTYRITVVSR